MICSLIIISRGCLGCGGLLGLILLGLLKLILMVHDVPIVVRDVSVVLVDL